MHNWLMYVSHINFIIILNYTESDSSYCFVMDKQQPLHQPEKNELQMNGKRVEPEYEEVTPSVRPDESGMKTFPNHIGKLLQSLMPLLFNKLYNIYINSIVNPRRLGLQ